MMHLEQDVGMQLQVELPERSKHVLMNIILEQK